MHARAATALVKLASKFDCEIWVTGQDGQGANAKSVMGLLLLCGSKGTTLHVRAEGADAHEAVNAIGELIAAGFELGEPE
jgi:phosphocarrier protein